MSDIHIQWKKITRGLPKIRRYADDRVPTIEEIQQLCEYPDRRIKGIVYTMASSGIRLGAWDYLRWKDIQPIEREGKVVASKIIVYARDDEEYFSFITPAVGAGWIKLHPESLENIPTDLQQAKPGLPPDAMNNQNIVGKEWEDNPNWSGACDGLAKLDKPTLVITGTDDNKYQPHVNSLKIVEKIPGAWLIQIKNAGHAVMDQYPEEMGKIMNTFLSTTAQSN
jgi:pimeloyl-ACP methyl ester carboxylesterase